MNISPTKSGNMIDTPVTSLILLLSGISTKIIFKS